MLLTAASLKLYGLSVSALPRVGWFASPQIHVLLAEWELVLGLWLLNGALPFWSWLAAIGTFSSFAVVSAYFGWIGVASCGCFGAIQASPWTAFGVDVAALALLAVGQPQWNRTRLRSTSSAAIGPLTALVILVVLTGLGSLVSGSPAAALAKLRGDTVTLSPDYLDFGTIAAGEASERPVTIWNWSNETIRIIGWPRTSFMTIRHSMPFEVQPGRSNTVALEFRAPKSGTGAVVMETALRTDAANAPSLPLFVGCRVERRPDGSNGGK